MQERQDNAIVPHDPRGDLVVMGMSSQVGAGPVHAPPPNIIRLLHTSLRGRYPIVLLLAISAMAGGGLLGYSMGQPLFRSEAIIRIQPRLPTILKRDPEQSTQMFASFVNTQASLLQHERVLSRAIYSDRWRQLGRGNLPHHEQTFKRSLTVKTSRDAPELIRVSFTDPEGPAAKVGLDEVLKAYWEFFGGVENTEVKNIQYSILEAQQRTYREKAASLRAEVLNDAAEYGTQDLEQFHSMKMQQLVGVERRIGDLQLVLAERAAGPGTEPRTEAALPEKATAEMIAARDPLMAGYMVRMRELERLLEATLGKGIGEGHEAVKAARSEIASQKKLIDEYTRIFNESREFVPPGGPDTADLAMESVEELQARSVSLKAQAAEWRREAVAIGNKRMAIDAKLREIAEQERRLDEINNRIEEVDIESKVEKEIGRIEIIYPETVPTSPTVDTRVKYAIVGAGLGGSGVIGLAVLLGLIDRRCRYSDQVSNPVDGKLLACLPVMKQGSAEEERLAAVHSLHQVRAQMQIVSPDYRIVAITSACPGDGKTSVCLSLGISFAGVGRRTLLIDLDLIGHGLSSRMRMCDGSGVLEALAAGTAEGFARPSHVPGMDILPTGSSVDASPARLRREEIRALFARAASLYDTILVDTGPLLGSLEANYVCAIAEGVLLVVGRGQSRTLYRRAVQHIRDINARLLGVVFNRARDTDFRSSTVSTSVRSVRSPSTGNGQVKPARSTGIDPLADAVFVDGFQELEDDSPNGPDHSSRAA